MFTESYRQSKYATAMENELRSLQGESLVASSGKLAYLDRMLIRLKLDGSRVLLFRY
jgi:hypothetical protein